VIQDPDVRHIVVLPWAVKVGFAMHRRIVGIRLSVSVTLLSCVPLESGITVNSDSELAALIDHSHRRMSTSMFSEGGEAHVRDLSAVGTLDHVILKFRREGTTVALLGMNEASATIVDQLATYDKPEALELMMKH
jgi:hypothetical protein